MRPDTSPSIPKSLILLNINSHGPNGNSTEQKWNFIPSIDLPASIAP